MAFSSATVPVLSISAAEDDHRALGLILGHSNWKLQSAHNRREAIEFLHRCEVPVVICDCDLPDGSWKDLLNETASLHHGAALIVASRRADDSLWAEVLNLGGCDVLAKPFDSKEVLWSVGLAWHEWSERFSHPQPALARS